MPHRSGGRIKCQVNELFDLLDDPNIDVFVQAQPYDTREAGNAMHVYQPVKSIDVHGKLYLFDHDPRTLGAGVLKYGRHRSQYEGAAVFARDYGHQWIENSGAWISDMSLSRWYNFEEYRLPWYTMPEVFRPIRNTLSALKTLASPRRNATEIAVVLSLNSPRYEDACRMVPLYKGLVNDLLLQKGFPFLGAPYDVILSGDLGHPNLPEYKLYVFLNPTYFTEAERVAIDRLKRGGKTLAWFYAPGYSTDDGLNLDALRAVCGINLKIKPNAVETPEYASRFGPWRKETCRRGVERSRETFANHPVADILRGRFGCSPCRPVCRWEGRLRLQGFWRLEIRLVRRAKLRHAGADASGAFCGRPSVCRGAGSPQRRQPDDDDPQRIRGEAYDKGFLAARRLGQRSLHRKANCGWQGS